MGFPNLFNRGSLSNSGLFSFGSFKAMNGPVDFSFLHNLRGLSSLKMPFNTPRLLDRSRPYFSGIKRFGMSKFENYWRDPFHTLLNLPWPRFVVLFFLTYLLEFLAFAFLFWIQTDRCVLNMEGRFANALWLSSRTASTLGYDRVQPNPDCPLVNLTVMIQVICASLVNYFMLGIVFARFSAPFKRAQTIRFSASACISRQANGLWALSLRVANVRKHQLLKPRLRMIVTAVDASAPSNYLFEHLEIDDLMTQETNLELGFPANVTHVIGATSPLLNLSLHEMDTRMMEVLVFVDGIDAMTSKNLTARSAYAAADMRLNEAFAPLQLEMRGKELGLNFKGFDKTSVASEQLLAEYIETQHVEDSCASAGGMSSLSEAQSQIWHLRHQSFRRLTERHASLGGRLAPAAVAMGKLAQLSQRLQRQQQQHQRQVVLDALGRGDSVRPWGVAAARTPPKGAAGPSSSSSSSHHHPLILDEDEALSAAAVVAALPGLNGQAGGAGGSAAEDFIRMMPDTDTALQQIMDVMATQHKFAQKWGLLFNGGVGGPNYFSPGASGDADARRPFSFGGGGGAAIPQSSNSGAVDGGRAAVEASYGVGSSGFGSVTHYGTSVVPPSSYKEPHGSEVSQLTVDLTDAVSLAPPLPLSALGVFGTASGNWYLRDGEAASTGHSDPTSYGRYAASQTAPFLQPSTIAALSKEPLMPHAGVVSDLGAVTRGAMTPPHDSSRPPVTIPNSGLVSLSRAEQTACPVQTRGPYQYPITAASPERLSPPPSPAWASVPAAQHLPRALSQSAPSPVVAGSGPSSWHNGDVDDGEDRDDDPDADGLMLLPLSKPAST